MTGTMMEAKTTVRVIRVVIIAAKEIDAAAALTRMMTVVATVDIDISRVMTTSALTARFLSIAFFRFFSIALILSVQLGTLSVPLLDKTNLHPRHSPVNPKPQLYRKNSVARVTRHKTTLKFPPAIATNLSTDLKRSAVFSILIVIHPCLIYSSMILIVQYLTFLQIAQIHPSTTVADNFTPNIDQQLLVLLMIIKD